MPLDRICDMIKCSRWMEIMYLFILILCCTAACHMQYVWKWCKHSELVVDGELTPVKWTMYGQAQKVCRHLRTHKQSTGLHSLFNKTVISKESYVAHFGSDTAPVSVALEQLGFVSICISVVLKHINAVGDPVSCWFNRRIAWPTFMLITWMNLFVSADWSLVKQILLKDISEPHVCAKLITTSMPTAHFN